MVMWDTTEREKVVSVLILLLVFCSGWGRVAPWYSGGRLEVLLRSVKVGSEELSRKDTFFLECFLI
jgi:hypothetical protein